MYSTLESAVYYTAAFLIVITLLAMIASWEPLRYFIKFIVFGLSAAISTTIYFPFMLLRIRDWRNALFSAKCVTTVIGWLGVKYQIRGKENIVEDTGSVVLINHQSVLDLCVLGLLWPVLKRCTVISKKEILYLGIFGVGSWLWGTIFINRQRGEEAQTAINATAKRLRDLKTNLLIFPEGHRHTNSKLLPFKKGAFHLAIASQMPLQPVVVSKYYFLNHKLKIFNSGVSYVNILPAIPTKGLTKEDLPKLMEDTYEIMNKTFQEVSQEALNEHVDSLKNE